MTEFDRRRLSDWLDDTDPESVVFGAVLGEESHNDVAESLLIHGLLTDLGRRDERRESARIQALMRAINNPSQTKIALANTGGTADTAVSRRPRLLVKFATGLAIAVAVIFMVSLVVPHQSAAAAMASLEKVLEAIAQPFDRTYEMHVVEEYPRDKRPRNLAQENWERKSEEQIDGARLYVRGADTFVFARKLTTGGQRVSGCDGLQSWAFREDGPVHVSSDPSRFRGGIPGEQQDMPFINMHSQLEQLRSGYDVELDQHEESAFDGTVLSRLVGTRKSQDVRGPKRVEIWFNAQNGTIHRLVLDGLPRGGGPKSVKLDLVSQSDLGQNFFSHESHHEPDRRVRYEEPQR